VTFAHACAAVPSETFHVTRTDAAHVAAAAAVCSAATACLCTSGKKAACKHCACQNHHHSSSHEILHCNGRKICQWVLSDAGVSEEDNADVIDELEMEIDPERHH
jgi:hypothetical protein